jgi:predicted transcriptional regulator of viral defense system
MTSISESISQQVKTIPEDTSFGYAQLRIEPDEFFSAAKALERLQKKGVIKRISRGRFYRPRKTVFGEKRPDESQLLKPYLFNQGKRKAYITGLTLYNQLGLTTQVPSTVQIASRERRNLSRVGSLEIKGVKSYVDVTEQNYQMLGFLDAMKDLKQIPDVDIKAALTLFKNRIKELSEEERQSLVTYALSYPPRVRALLGAILEELSYPLEATKLKESLNPLTKYALGIDDTLLKSASNWNVL